MFILEGSDTQLTFQIQKKTSSWQTTQVDLTVYDKILLEMRYIDGIVEYEWELVDGDNTHSKVTFDILSESTKWRTGKIKCDIRGVKNEQKVRFNTRTIVWEVLYSLTIPTEWTAND